MRPDCRVWRVTGLRNTEQSPCPTPKLRTTRGAGRITPFPSAPLAIKPLTRQLRLIFLTHKYQFYCCSWEDRNIPWFFLVRVWVSVLSKVISYVLCDQYVWLFQPKNIRAFLLLSVWSGVKLLAVNWASLRHTPTPHPHILTCNNLRARPGLETVWLSLSSNRTNNEKY